MATHRWQAKDFVNSELYKIVDNLLLGRKESLENSGYISFEQNLAFSVQSNEITCIQEDSDGIHISSNVLNLWGLYGPLPDSYNELFSEQERSKNYALKEFFNIFHNRLVTIGYTIFKQASPLTVVDIVLGLSPLHLKNLPLNQWFFQKTKTVSGLESLVHNIFKVPVFVHELTGGLCEADENAWSKLGTQYTTLGRNAILGRKYYAPAMACDVVIGPLLFDVFFKLWLHRLEDLKYLCFVYLPLLLKVNFVFQVKKHKVEKSFLDGSVFLGINSFAVSHPQMVDSYAVRISS